MKNILWGLLFIFFAKPLLAQSDAESIKILVNRAINFDESKTDSLFIYAKLVEQNAKKANYQKGICDSYRLRGMYYEYKADYQKAIEWQLKYLNCGEQFNINESQLFAMSDLSALYNRLKQYSKAIEMVKKAIKFGEKIETKPKHLSTFYQNLGIYYRRLDQDDSALYNYRKSLIIKQKVQDSIGIANLNINIGSLLISQRKFDEAKPYFVYNVAYHKRTHSETDLWFDYMNLSGIYLGQKKYKASKQYLDDALRISKKVKSKAKEAETYLSLAGYYEERGDFKNAFLMSRQFHQLESESINLETSKSIAELQEKYEADKREQQNKLLEAEVATQKLQKRNVAIIAVAASLLALLVVWAWWKNRKKNQLLTQKNEEIDHKNRRLSELNSDKNALISIVSHDLGNPFATIKLWTNLLAKTTDSKAREEALQIIHQTAESGIRLVKTVLDIEKMETNKHQLNLENFDLVLFVQNIVKNFEPASQAKSIKVEVQAQPLKIFFLSDKQLVMRVIENLLSNALKYSQSHTEVFVKLKESKQNVEIEVEDQGIGISADELHRLFSKYGKLSSRPTANEDSTGLGLSIVKRVVEELGGKITCRSQEGVGSVFVVTLPK